MLLANLFYTKQHFIATLLTNYLPFTDMCVYVYPSYHLNFLLFLCLLRKKKSV